MKCGGFAGCRFQFYDEGGMESCDEKGCKEVYCHDCLSSDYKIVTCLECYDRRCITHSTGDCCDNFRSIFDDSEEEEED